MAKFPEVQRKAQSELDAHVGQTRLPDFGDLDSLHFIRAIIMEAMRWRPVAPFGLLHRLVREDQYNGYYIPKGTNVVPVSAASIGSRSRYRSGHDSEHCFLECMVSCRHYLSNTYST